MCRHRILVYTNRMSVMADTNLIILIAASYIYYFHLYESRSRTTTCIGYHNTVGSGSGGAYGYRVCSGSRAPLISKATTAAAAGA
jgi:hypothetical protein